MKQWLAGLLLVTAMVATANSVHAADGVISLPSAHDVATTTQRLVKALEAKGMRIFTQVDHAAGAASVDLELRPTHLVIFGNPKVGTQLMQCHQTAALDLPQKALIWQDEDGRVWLSYNDPVYMAKRHGIEDCGPVVEKIQQALANFARAATEGEAKVDSEDEIFY